MTKATKLDKEIGEKIEINRKLKNKTQNWLANKINVSYQQIQNYEHGRHRIAASRLLGVAHVLKTPIEKFFPNKNEK